MLLKDNIRRRLGIFQLIFFCFIIVNGILFIHSHKLADGRIIVHAHPFFPQEDGNPLPHQHTANELIILGQFFHPGIIFSEISLFDFSVYTTELFSKKPLVHFPEYNRSFLYLNRRGPPLTTSITAS